MLRRVPRTLYCATVNGQFERVLDVIIVEDDPVAHANLARAISDDKRMRLVAAATNCVDGLACLMMPHDVIVVDIGLPDGTGIDIIKFSAERGLGHRLVSTVFGDETSVVSALEAGADGYILKDNEQITDAIVEVARGHVPLTPSVAVHLVRRMRPKSPHEESCLTPREAQILSCLARGQSYRETASELSISYHTVTDHIKAIYKKLHVNSRSRAVYQGLRSGLISLGTDA